MTKTGGQKGFTLIEILVVIGLIAILAAIVLVAINPGRQFAQANNSQRMSNIEAILNAIGQYTADNKGSLPAAITTSTTTIESSGGIDLCSVLVPTYMAALPVDPKAGSYNGCDDYDTGYAVVKDAVTSRVTVTAPEAELNETISSTR